jgi:hypothetical protein
MVAVRLRGTSSKKMSPLLMKDTSSQIQILSLANSDLNKKGRQLPAGQSVFVKFSPTTAHSLEIHLRKINPKVHK